METVSVTVYPTPAFTMVAEATPPVVLFLVIVNVASEPPPLVVPPTPT